ILVYCPVGASRNPSRLAVFVRKTEVRLVPSNHRLRIIPPATNRVLYKAIKPCLAASGLGCCSSGRNAHFGQTEVPTIQARVPRPCEISFGGRSDRGSS